MSLNFLCLYASYIHVCFLFASYFVLFSYFCDKNMYTIKLYFSELQQLKTYILIKCGQGSSRKHKLSSKAPQSLEKSILDDLVNWIWDLINFPTMIQLRPSLVVKESYHLLVPLMPSWFSDCFPPDEYSYYKIRINYPWHAESLLILIWIVFKERNVSAYSIHVGMALKTLTDTVPSPQLAIILLKVHRLCPSDSSLWFTQ